MTNSVAGISTNPVQALSADSKSGEVSRSKLLTQQAEVEKVLDGIIFYKQSQPTTSRSSLRKNLCLSMPGDESLNRKLMEGSGIYKEADGSVYTGSFKAGKFDGEGIKIYSNGDSYTGQWKNDKMHGHGTLKQFRPFISSPETWEGTWQEGRKEGKFKITVGKVTRKEEFKNDREVDSGCRSSCTIL